MNNRKRILKALSHEEPDRVPRDLGGTESSGLTASSLSGLHSFLQISDPVKIFEPYQYVGYVGETLRTQFKIDTCNQSCNAHPYH